MIESGHPRKSLTKRWINPNKRRDTLLPKTVKSRNGEYEVIHEKDQRNIFGFSWGGIPGLPSVLLRKPTGPGRVVSIVYDTQAIQNGTDEIRCEALMCLNCFLELIPTTLLVVVLPEIDYLRTRAQIGWIAPNVLIVQ